MTLRILQGLKSRLEQNWFVHLVYKGKTDLDIGAGVIGWFTGKMVEVMALSYLLEKFHISITGWQIVIVSVIIVIGLTGFGWFWKESGLRDTELKTAVTKDPIMHEVYQAALKINRSKRFK